MATDNGSPSNKSAQATVVITLISSNNDYSPVLDKGNYVGTIDENSPAGTSILEMVVTDDDVPGSKDTVKNFTLSGADSIYFYVEKFGYYGILRSRYVYCGRV